MGLLIKWDETIYFRMNLQLLKLYKSMKNNITSRRKIFS